MDKTLQMVFLNNSGKSVSLNISGVKDDVTPVEIKTVMELIIAKNIFDSTGGDLKTIMSANVVSRDVQEITVR
jgi:hypothetical protein